MLIHEVALRDVKVGLLCTVSAKGLLGLFFFRSGTGNSH
jgi:hypothetical protein